MGKPVSYPFAMSTLAVAAVVAWAVFAWTYRTFFPMDVGHGEALGRWALWCAAGTGAALAGFEVLARWLAVPPAYRIHAAVAATAPALVCDTLTGTQPHRWLPGAGEAADSLYLSLIVGGVGLLQLYALLTSAALRATPGADGTQT